MKSRFFVGAALAAALLSGGASLSAAHAADTVVSDWSKIDAPTPPPQLKPVTVDPKTTALLVLDFTHQICNEKSKPRCVASLPTVKKLIGEARDSHTMVVFSTAGTMTAKDIWADVAPATGEPVVNSHANKFQDTDLQKILNNKGIKTVIVTGVNANGAVLYTASEAAFLGFKVIDPIDGSSAENQYIEQYVVYNFAHAPLVSSMVTLTSANMIKF